MKLPMVIDARVVEERGRGDEPGLEPGGGGDQLEGRSGGVLALDGPVERGVAGVVEQGLVVRLADAADELGRVVGRVGRQGQDLAVVGILDDGRSGRGA